MTRRRFATVMCLAPIALAISSRAYPAETPHPIETPVEIVVGFHATTAGVMQDAESLGYAGRRAAFEPAVNRSFDFAFIARLVMGQHWPGLRADQREALVRVLNRLTISRYASEFDGFSGERFALLEERPLKRGRVLVRTEIVRPGDEDVSLDYILHEVDGQWRIVNVVAQGVSDLALKRSEYGSIIEDEGFDRLLERLTEQAARYEADASS